MKLDLDQLQEIQEAIIAIVDHRTNTSCDDPDCCVEYSPSMEEYHDKGIATLSKYGLEVVKE